MIINNFTGGLSRYVSANLINTNESVVCTNVELLKGSLTPIKEDTIYSTSSAWLNQTEFYWFEGNWVTSAQGTSFTTFANKLYYSTGIGPLKVTNNGSDIFDLGIDAPPSALNIKSNVQPEGTLSISSVESDFDEAAIYKYRIVYVFGDHYNYEDLEIAYDPDTDNSIQIDIKGISTSSDISIYRLYDGRYRLLKEHSGGSNTTLTYNDVVYFIEENNPITYIDGYSKVNTRQYCYTYASSVYGYESAPSPLTEETEILGDTTLTGFVASSNPLVDQYKVYRIGGDITNLTLIETYSDSTTSVLDNKSDLSIAENDLLMTTGSTKPPDGLNHLSLYNSTLFASLDSKLYFSETALPNNWSELNTIEVSDTIIGMGATQNGLLIFTRNKTFLLRGTDASNFSLILLNGEQGCIDHSTISYINNMLVWVSLDGICSSIGAGVTNMTEQRLGKISLNTYGSVVSNNKYYLFHETGTYVLDYRSGNMTISEVDTIYYGGHYSNFHDSIFMYRSDDVIVEFANSTTNRSLSYKTGWLTEGSLTKQKMYKKLYIFVTGDMLLNTYVDGRQSLENIELLTGYNELMVPQDDTRGYYTELQFSGTNSVVQLEVVIEIERVPYDG